MGTPGRLELKFTAETVRRHELLAWLRMHRIAFRTAYPPRWVNNIYFDSHDLAAFRLNTAGVGTRVKARYRWYGDAFPVSAGALEIKEKRGRLGWKRSFPVEHPPSGTYWRSIARSIRTALPPKGRLWLDGYPCPVLINRYLREYLVSGDGKLRVTLDRDQTVTDQRIRQRPAAFPPVNLPEVLVLEIKCLEDAHDSAETLAAGLPLRASRHSKYAAGAETLFSS